MVEKIQSEERLRIETLRGISLLADYLDSSSIVSILWMGALSSAIIGAFFVLTFSSFVLGLLTLYFGVVFAIYGVFLRSRFRRRFNRRYETLFRPLLTQSSDYNAIVRDLDLRVNHLLVELAEKEGELARFMRPIESEFDVARPDRRAIGELDAGTQLEGDVQRVRRNFMCAFLFGSSEGGGLGPPSSAEQFELEPR